MDEPAFLDRRPLPALVHSSSGPLLPHVSVLDEALSPAGVLLWAVLRDAALWGTAAPDRREGLFADGARTFAGTVPELEEELGALAVLVRDPHPDAGPVIAHLCSRVAAWAEGQGLGGTALAFAQGAALAYASDARLAYEVGRLARVRAEYVRAEAWYQRALVLAARGGDKETQARTYGGLANIHGLRGNYALAMKLTKRMSRLASRHGLHDERADAAYGLAVLNFEAGTITEGMRLARAALGFLDSSDPRVRSMVHDMAVALMDRCGAFGEALPVLRALLPHTTELASRVLALANLARAAAATGQASLFEPLWTEVWAITSHARGDGFLDALIALANGAAGLHQTDRAREAANRALETAEASRAGKSISAVKALLESLGGEGIRPALPAVTDESARDFAHDLVRALRMHPVAMDEETLLLADVLKKPEDPQPAYAFARALRSMAEYERAEAWFGHTIRLAQRSGDAMMEARCLGGLGNLHFQHGDLARAYDLHQSHLEFARREGLRDMEGMALIDLCATSFASDRGDDGFAYAQEALRVLGHGHFLLPRLGHDLAIYLMENRKDFENALLLFRALRSSELPSEDRVLLEASLARAAAGAGEAQAFEEGWTAVWSAMEGRAGIEINVWALIHIAYGALLRGLYEHAGRAAQHANLGAVARGETHLAATTMCLLKTAEDAAKTHARPGLGRDPGHDARSAQRLARGIATALRPRRRQNGVNMAVPTLRGDLT